MMHVCESCHQPLPEFGGITADPGRREVSFRGKVVTLSLKEFQVFALLLGRSGRPMNVREAHEQIYQFDPNGGPDPFTINVYICRMRKKITPLGLFVDNHWYGAFSLRDPSKLPAAA